MKDLLSVVGFLKFVLFRSSILSPTTDRGLNSKVKLSPFCKAIDFKAYLCVASDAGPRLMLKCRLGKHVINEQLGKHRGREDFGCEVYGPSAMAAI